MILSSSNLLFKPYAKAAAVGSFIILRTLKPTLLAIDIIIFLWLSLKLEGTVNMVLNCVFGNFLFKRTIIWLKNITKISFSW